MRQALGRPRTRPTPGLGSPPQAAARVTRRPRADEREDAEPDREERPLVEGERADPASDRKDPRPIPPSAPDDQQDGGGEANQAWDRHHRDRARRADVREHEPDPVAPRPEID